MKITTMMAVIITALIIGFTVTSVFDCKMVKDNEKYWKGMYERMNDNYAGLIDYVCEGTDEKTKLKILEYVQKQYKKK